MLVTYKVALILFRIYIFRGSCIELLLILDTHTKHCVQSVHHQIIFSENDLAQVIIFTTATDGFVTIWNITVYLENYRNNLHCRNNTKIFSVNSGSDKAEGTELSSVDGKENMNCEETLIEEYDGDDKNENMHHSNENKYKFHSLNVPLFNDIQPCCQVKLHQSGVNAFDILKSTEGK